MRTLFFTSSICAFVSLLAEWGFSMMTYIHTPHVEHLRTCWLLGIGAFFVGWLSLALWSRAQRRDIPLSRWFTGLLVAFEAMYCFALFWLFGIRV